MSRRRRIDRWRKDAGWRSRLSDSAWGVVVALPPTGVHAGWCWTALALAIALDVTVYLWPSPHVRVTERL